MNYENPWSDYDRFICLGEFTYKGSAVDLYVLKHKEELDQPMYFSMGMRRSNNPSDYIGIPLNKSDVEKFECNHYYAFVPEIVKRLRDKGLIKEWGFHPSTPSV